MFGGKIVRDSRSLGSRFYAEIEGERLFDAEVPSSLSVQKFYFKKDGKQVYLIRFNPSEGIKNAARDGKDRKNDLYGLSEIALKVLSIFIVIGEVKTKHKHAMVSFEPKRLTKNKKILSKYDAILKTGKKKAPSAIL